MLTTIKKYMLPTYRENSSLLRAQQKLFISLCATAIILATIILLYNHWGSHYQTQNIFLPNIWRQGIQGLLFYIGSYSLSPRLKRIAIALRATGLLFMTIFCLAMMVIAVTTTPQTTTIDQALHHADLALGYSTINVLHWFFHHPSLAKALANFYHFYYVEVYYLAAPLMCLFCYDLEVLAAANVASLASLTGLIIYYIWPSTGPAVIFKTHYFINTKLYTTYQAFVQTHHYSAKIVAAPFGLISFPSFHVLTALFILYLFRRISWIFYPLLTYNTVLFFSTFLLGIHFLTDALASLVIFFACAVCVQWITKSLAKESGLHKKS